MAKIKKNLFSFILTIASLLTGVLAFVSLAFKPFAKQVMGSASFNVSLKDWLDALNRQTPIKIDGLTEWKVARVFMIITLVLVAIATVLAIVRFFVSNKYVDIALVVVGALVIVSSLVMMITLLVGASKMSNKVVSIKAGVSPICLVLFSVLNGAIATTLGAVGLAKKSK